MKTKLLITFLLFIGASVFTACDDKDDSVDDSEKMAIPQDVTAVAGGTAITVTWSSVADATYNVYHSTDNKTYIKIASLIEETKYVDETPVTGKNYYRVTAIVGGVESGYGNVAVAEWKLPVGSEWIDPEFAKELQKRGYIADAATVTPADVADITEIYVRCRDLTSLRGIEYFTSLQKLYGDYNGLTELDVSRNTQLTHLYCTDNRLTQLDVSRNTQLMSLYCAFNQLTQLDVSRNTQLTYLDCDWNQLTQLDVSRNTQLTKLFCTLNQLTQLDVSGATQLTSLYCAYNQLTQLDVSRNTQLAELNCSDNKLTQLDVSGATQLTYLGCSDNKLTQLDVSGATQLTDLGCSDNQLTQLDVSRNTQLTWLDCCYNELTQLDVSNNTQLEILRCYGNPGADGQFRVKAWFDNYSIPTSITNDSDYKSSWLYNGKTVSIYYYK
ncbi:MAG: hypothetical protein K2M94_00180 [Paramuribaculum sp.]|nr:hypothetical protein [Paramuribaculum sp.]